MSKSSSKPITTHVCYKNWSGPYTAMESYIKVERFSQSIKNYNLIDSNLIEDSDNSVIKIKNVKTI